MGKQLVILVLIASIISCKENKTGISATKKADRSEIAKQNLSLDNIIFDFSVSKDKEKDGFFKIDAVLFNSNGDTVYLFTWTDHGKQYSLLYDTTKFEYFPEWIANATFPIVEKIPPKGNLRFTADFKLKNQERKIKLDYEFCRIEKQPDTDFQKMDFNKVSDFWKNRQRTILHTTEKTIE